MRIINAAQTGVLPLGRLGENEASKIIFDVSAFLSEYPNAAIGLYNQRAGDGSAYPVANISVSGNTAEWLITNTELTKVGNGKCELVAIQDNVVVKSQIYCTVVFEALDGSGNAPEPWDSWQNEFIELKDEAQQAAQNAETAVTHYPRIVNKIWEVWDAVNGQYVSTGVVAEGEDGQDGVSPVITVTDISGGHRVKITDASGTNTFDVLNGTDGQNGTNGTDGTDAYVYIRYSAAEPTSDSDMKTTPDAWIGIYSGDAATAPTTYTSYTWYKIKGETGAAGVVQDVQVNGTSVLDAQGVANVPKASRNVLGVARAGDGLFQLSTGAIIVNRATSAHIKGGTASYNPIVPVNQHESVFYGFAKAAGDTTQSASSNAVGTYTDAAKRAIKDMLEIPSWVDSDYRLIYSVTVTDQTAVDINSDLNGDPLLLHSVFILATCPASQEASSGIAIGAYDGSTQKGLGYINKSTNTTEKKRGYCIIDATHGLWKTEQAAFGTSGIIALQTYTRFTDVLGGQITKVGLSGLIAGYEVSVYGY